MALPLSFRPIPLPGQPSRSSRCVMPEPSAGAAGLRLQLAATALVAAVLALVAPGVARADAELMKAKNCTACHAIDKKLIGPSYKDVAAKYAGDPKAVDKLARKIREGGVGTWGQIPMPANQQVSAEEGTRLATWILGQK